MPIPESDVIAIEQAGETLARAVNAGDISALADFFTSDAVALPPARPIVRHANLSALFRNMALQSGGLRLMSEDMAAIGADAVRDVGTMSLRPKQTDAERVTFKYLILWQREGTAWKLASMAWNRGARNRRVQDEGGDEDGM